MMQGANTKGWQNFEDATLDFVGDQCISTKPPQSVSLHRKLPFKLLKPTPPSLLAMGKKLPRKDLTIGSFNQWYLWYAGESQDGLSPTGTTIITSTKKATVFSWITTKPKSSGNSYSLSTC
jgi:hypothetical protein